MRSRPALCQKTLQERFGQAKGSHPSGFEKAEETTVFMNSFSSTLANQVPGFTVEGQDLPVEHPQHPSKKTGVLFKAIKGMVTHRSGQREGHYKAAKRIPHTGPGKSIIISSTIHTKPRKP
jgi:hypothetical protein